MNTFNATFTHIWIDDSHIQILIDGQIVWYGCGEYELLEFLRQLEKFGWIKLWECKDMHEYLQGMGGTTNDRTIE